MMVAGKFISNRLHALRSSSLPIFEAAPFVKMHRMIMIPSAYEISIAEAKVPSIARENCFSMIFEGGFIS